MGSSIVNITNVPQFGGAIWTKELARALQACAEGYRFGIEIGVVGKPVATAIEKCVQEGQLEFASWLHSQGRLGQIGTALDAEYLSAPDLYEPVNEYGVGYGNTAIVGLDDTLPGIADRYINAVFEPLQPNFTFLEFTRTGGYTWSSVSHPVTRYGTMIFLPSGPDKYYQGFDWKTGQYSDKFEESTEAWSFVHNKIMEHEMFLRNGLKVFQKHIHKQSGQIYWKEVEEPSVA
jgi:hypothetical protein